MNRFQKTAILTQLVVDLREHGSWTGETHLQKATYLLQEALGCPTGFEFILYFHGPFSFDLRDELTGLRAEGFLCLEPQAAPYGPKFATASLARAHAERLARAAAPYDAGVKFIASRLGGLRVKDLEKLATALFATRELGDGASVQQRARRLHEIKPHVPLDEAEAAVESLDEILREAGSLGLIQ